MPEIKQKIIKYLLEEGIGFNIPIISCGNMC